MIALVSRSTVTVSLPADGVGLPQLQSIVIGNDCFKKVTELKLVGLSRLESVVVGDNSFVRSGYGSRASGVFQLKDCPKLKELKMGRYSFSDYSVCEIEDTPALETIQIGDLGEEGCENFQDASLQLKGM